MNDCLCKIAEEASKLLNDSYDCDPEYNFTRWGKEELVHYAKDAITNIFMLYPQKFTTCVTIDLVEGSVQKLPEDCVLMTKLIGSDNGIDAASSIASKTDERLGNLFSNKCSGPLVASNYEVESYSIEETSDNIFYVKPPVPKSKEPLQVSVICSEHPNVDDKNYCPEAWMHNAIIEWMLYRAYSSEDESTTSANNANMHLEHFYALIRSYMQASEILKRDIPNATSQR